MSRIAERRNWKPATPRVNWAHISASGLQGYGMGVDEWTGIPRRSSALPSTTDLIQTLWGGGLRPQATIGRCAEFVVVGSLPVTRTIMVWVGMDSTSTRGVAAGFSGLDGSTFSGVACGADNIGTGGNEMLGVDSGFTRETNTNIGGGFHSLALTTTDSLTGDYFIDGAFVANIAQYNTSNTSPWYFEVGGYQAGFFNEFRSMIGPWAGWNRLLTAGEIAKLHADPFQMLRR